MSLLMIHDVSLVFAWYSYDGQRLLFFVILALAWSALHYICVLLTD